MALAALERSSEAPPPRAEPAQSLTGLGERRGTSFARQDATFVNGVPLDG